MKARQIIEQVDKRAAQPKKTKAQEREEFQEAQNVIKRGLAMNNQYKIKYRFDQFRVCNYDFDLYLDGYTYFAQKMR